MIGVPLSFSQESEGPSYLFSENAYYIEDLYSRYLKDPNAVPEAWRDYFTTIQDGIPDARDAAAVPKTSAPSPVVDALKQTAALRLITVYRVRGHQQADVDPLRLRPRPPVPDLDPAFHNLSEADMDTVFHTGALELGLRGQKAGSRALAATGQLPLRKIIELARQIYCGSIGSEYMHITDTTQKRWIQERLEQQLGKPQFTAEERRQILQRVTAAEGLERYLHTKYVGQKRFSLEGAESLIPLLDELIQRAGTHKIGEVVLGMAHREIGRASCRERV